LIKKVKHSKMYFYLFYTSRRNTFGVLDDLFEKKIRVY